MKAKLDQIAEQAALATLGAGGNYVDDRTAIIRAALDEALALPVTEEMTAAMITAGVKRYEEGLFPTKESRVSAIYRAMRSAQIKEEG